MKTEEYLSWILDNKKDSYSNEDKIKKNIEFIHSLGLKCDSVGWCNLDLNRSETAVLIMDLVNSAIYQKYQSLGGKLPELARMFYDLDIDLPIQLPKNKIVYRVR